MFCIAFLVRTYVGTPVVGFLAPRLIGNRLQGVPRGIAGVVLAVIVTSPITSGIVAFLFSNPDDFADVYVSSLSVTMPMTMLANYLVIGPIVKLVFHRIKPDFGLRILNALNECGHSLSRFLGF